MCPSPRDQEKPAPHALAPIPVTAMSIRRAAQPPGGRSEVCPADLREPSAKQDGWSRAVESRVRDEK